MKTALVTYLYPSVLSYLPELISCIDNQTAEKFEVIFFNDGVKNLDKNSIFNRIKLPFHIYNLSGSLAEIRYRSFEILSNLDYENIIFQDADDLMTENRIERLIYYLKSHDLVVNDLDLIFEKGDVISKNFWSGRLSNETFFDSTFILDKNIVGLGNSSIKKDLLTLPFKKSDYVIAVDWFFFYQLLKLSNAEGVFINSGRTLYRQHRMNTVGITKVNENRIEQAKRVKEIHYRELIKIGYDFEFQLSKLLSVDTIRTNRINNNKHHFWWEETEYLE